AALLGGRIFGRLADRSSKHLMSIGAGIASTIVLAIVILATIPELLADNWVTNVIFIGAYFTLTLMHTGVRIRRKTYVVEMAEGDQRTTYVAVSNTALGLVLLLIGGISSVLATWHVALALLFLAAS